jgi:hypothetical protein
LSSAESPAAGPRGFRGARRRSTASSLGAESFVGPPILETLEDVLAEFGLRPGPHIEDFANLAAASQAGRYGRSESVRIGITRSIAIWAAARVDPRIATAMADAGFDMAEFGRLIGAQLPASGGSKDNFAHDVDPEFADSLRASLASRLSPAPAEVSDIALAVLRASQSPGQGQFRQRLIDAGGQIASAIDRIEDLTGAEPLPNVDIRDFSESIRTARSNLGATTSVTASSIVRELQMMHSSYAENRLGHVPLQVEEGIRRTTDDWLARVRGCFDVSKVRATRHEVIDTELTLLALAGLDSAVAVSLGTENVLSWLRTNVAVLPDRLRADPTEWSSDAPAIVDELGRGPIATDLAKRIRRLAEEDSPDDGSFMVHIDGPWGAGKSSLFSFLRQEFADAFIVVGVNAWREQRVGVQWWTLFSALQAEIAAQATLLGRCRLWLVGTADRIRANWVPFSIALLILGGVLVGLAVGLNFADTSVAADAIVKSVSLATVAFAGLAAVSKYLIPNSMRSAQGLLEGSENPTREVARIFLRALRRAPKPVVFMIDDLDRCDGQYVVEFLEVVQTLVRDVPRLLDERQPESSGANDSSTVAQHSPQAGRRTETRRSDRRVIGPYVFIAADGGWIRSSFEDHFKAFGTTFENGRPLGYLFLEKLFQLHVRLPDVTPAAREAYLARLLGTARVGAAQSESQQSLIASTGAAVDRATSETAVLEAAQKATDIKDPATRLRVLGQAAAKFSEPAIERSPDHPLADFHDLLEANPRSMKLFVNAYGVARSMLTVQERFVPVGQLALWTVLEVRWPRLADYLRENPEIASRWQETLDAPADIDKMLRAEDVSRVLTDSRWDGFSPDRVRECAGVS